MLSPMLSTGAPSFFASRLRFPTIRARSPCVESILSTSPFDSILNEATEVGDSRAYLLGLSKSRGLVVKPAEHSVSVRTMSKKLED